MKTRFRFLVIFALFILIFAGCSNEQAGSKEDGGSLKGEYITILTGGSAGVYYVLGGTLAKLYQEEFKALWQQVSLQQPQPKMQQNYKQEKQK